MIRRIIFFSFLFISSSSPAFSANYYFSDSDFAYMAALNDGNVNSVFESGCWGHIETNKGNYYLYPVSFLSSCQSEYDMHGVVFRDYDFLMGLSGAICGFLLVLALLLGM